MYAKSHRISADHTAVIGVVIQRVCLSVYFRPIISTFNVDHYCFFPALRVSKFVAPPQEILIFAQLVVTNFSFLFGKVITKSYYEILLSGRLLCFLLLMGVHKRTRLPEVEPQPILERSRTDRRLGMRSCYTSTAPKYSSPGDRRLMVFHTRHVRIKIFQDKPGAEAANAKFRFTTMVPKAEYVQNIKE